MNDLRHHLAHIQVIHPDDMPRFAALGVGANMQPLWACHEPQMDELTIPFLGEPRWRWQYPFGDLERAGARLGRRQRLVGQQPGRHVGRARRCHPHAAAGRRRPLRQGAVPAGAGDQSLESALTAYTQGSAWVNHLDDVTGTLEVGKYADLALLDRDPFAGDPSEIGTTQVAQTFVEGERVFAR